MSLLGSKSKSSGVRRKYYALLLIFFLLLPIAGAYLAWNAFQSQTQRAVNMGQAMYYGYTDIYLYYLFEMQQLQIAGINLQDLTQQNQINNLITVYLWIQAWIDSINPIITPYDFIVTQDGSNYIAYYGANNTVAYSGTDMSIILQDCLDNSVNGNPCSIFIKQGKHLCYSQINITGSMKGWSITGAGRGGYPFPNQTTGTTLIMMANGTLFNINYTGNYTFNENFMIKDLAITGNPDESNWLTTTAINIVEGMWFSLENLYVSFVYTGLNCVNCGVHRLSNVIFGQIYGGVTYDTCVDWQWYYVEVDANFQPENTSAVVFKNSVGTVIGGHFEGYRGISLYADIPLGFITFDSILICFTNSTAIYTEIPIKITNSILVGGNAYNQYADYRASTIHLNYSGYGSWTCQTSIVNTLIDSAESHAVYSIYGGIDSLRTQVIGNTVYRQIYLPSILQVIEGNFLNEDVTVGNHSNIIGNTFTYGTIITAGSFSVIKDNSGLGFSGQIIPTPSLDVSVTNTYPSQVEVIICVGGTATTVAKNGVTIFTGTAQTISVTLNYGETVGVSQNTDVSWTWWYV